MNNVLRIRKTDTVTTGVWLSLARALDLGSRGRRFESCHPDFFNVRVQFNGRTLAFQARYVGSIPITRLAECHMCLQLSWIEQRPSKPWVGGSNPFGHTETKSFDKRVPCIDGPRFTMMVGMAQLVSAPDCGSGGQGFESLYPPSFFIGTCGVAQLCVVDYWAIAKR